MLPATHYIPHTPSPTPARPNGTSILVQMAHDALVHLSEQQRLVLALDIVTGARLSCSAVPLNRIATAAGATSNELSLLGIRDQVQEPDICPKFMMILHDFYDRAELPTFEAAFGHALRFVANEKWAISTPTSKNARAALVRMALNNRTHKEAVK
ncbi:MAG: hypothetical protein ACI9HB_001727 [Gammaproteobacteria bacterium]|jgi:hypothetical protein